MFNVNVYVFSSTKLEIRAERVLPGSEGSRGQRKGLEAGGRNGPNNVCTFEQMNEKIKKKY
jgi:hypothetical protein